MGAKKTKVDRSIELTLFIDIGNTKTKLAVFDEAEGNIEQPLIYYSMDCSQDTIGRAFIEIKSKFDIDNIYCCSVAIRYNEILIDCAKKIFMLDIRFVTIDDIPIKVLTEDYRFGGFDRLLLAYAALHMYKSKGYEAHVIVGLGTATTTNVIDNNGVFLGGIIMPGVHTSFEGLCNRTGLPMYEMPAKEDNIPSTLGNTTETCMRSGIFHHSVGLIKGAFEATEAELLKNYNIKNINFCITGGYSNVLYTYMNENVHYHPHLVLQGLFFSNQQL